MSKTIEIASTVKGKVRLLVKGVSRQIVFEDKGDVGLAMCDSDEAEVLLQIPGYRKVGASTQSTQDMVDQAINNDPQAASAAAELFDRKADETGEEAEAKPAKTGKRGK